MDESRDINMLKRAEIDRLRIKIAGEMTAGFEDRAAQGSFAVAPILRVAGLHGLVGNEAIPAVLLNKIDQHCQKYSLGYSLWT